jgi:ABC-type sugar transport system permease subunit
MTNGAEPVTIRDIDVPFWRIVVILIKWSIAAIPAAIIMAIVFALILGVIGAATGIFRPAPVPVFPVPLPAPSAQP